MRYLIAGGLSYLIEMLILITLRYGVSLGDLLSVGLSYWLGFIFSFFLQRSFAFRDKARTKRVVSAQFVATVILLALNYLVTLALVGLLAGQYHINIVLVRTIAVILISSWNFLFFRTLFSKEAPQSTT